MATELINGVTPPLTVPKEWRTLSHGPQAVLGTVPKINLIHKFGQNGAVGTSEEDIWNVGGDETLMTSGQTLYISCTDNTNGVGQKLIVFGLDENWNRQVATVELAGQTKTVIAGLWTRVHRCHQISASPDPVGDVYVYENDTVVAGVPQTASKIHAFIDYTDAAQQTLKALYTVPAGYVGLITRFHAEMGEITTGTARSCLVALEVAELAQGATVSNPSWAPRRRIMSHDVSTGGPSDTADWNADPHVFGPLTNIHARGKATATSFINVEFTLILIPENVEGWKSAPQNN